MSADVADSLLESITVNIGAVSYSISALTFVLLTVLLFASWKRGWVGAWLIAASVLTAAWSVSTAYGYVMEGNNRLASSILEVLRGAGWLLFLAGVLSKTWDTGENRKVGRLVFPAIVVLSIFNLAISFVHESTEFNLMASVGLCLLYTSDAADEN